MSLLGKYRKEEQGRDDEPKSSTTEPSRTSTQTRVVAKPYVMAVPNKERKSPIMSFSITTELRSCLQEVRNEYAINLSMWVERKLRDAIAEEFPNIAEKHLG